MWPSFSIRVQAGITDGLRAAADLLFPPVCAVCGSPGVGGAELLCGPCEAAVDRLCCTAYCPTCSRTVPPFAVSGGRCNHCREHKMHVVGTVRVGPYGDEFGTLLRAFKYRRRWTLAAYLGRRLAKEIERAPWFDSLEALVTVPPWWPRRILAGDYPPAMLARVLSGRTGIPLIPALRRVKGGPSQIGLTATQRIQNVRGKFAMTRGVRLEAATLCLIDDIMTTGATLEECAKTLRAAGAGDVYAAVAAHVSPGSPSTNLPQSRALKSGGEL